MQRAKQNGFIVIIAILAAIVVVAIVIFLIVRSGDDQSESTNQTSNQAGQSQQGSDEAGVQLPGVNPDPDPDPDPNPSPDPEPVDPTSGLPDNWDQLTSSEKIALNPLGCDTASQVIWASDGSCHDKNNSSATTTESLDYIILRESLSNSCVNYQRGSGICGVEATIAVAAQPTPDALLPIALKIKEGYDPQEIVHLEVLRDNGGDQIEDYYVWGVGWGPLVHRGYECGKFLLSSGGGIGNPWSEYGDCQTDFDFGLGEWDDPDLVPVPATQAPLRYVSGSLEAICDSTEASFCSISFDVVLLVDIDIEQARADQFSIAGFGMIYAPDNDDSSCLTMSHSFVDLPLDLDAGWPHKSRVYLACHDGQLPSTLKAGSRHLVKITPIALVDDTIAGEIRIKTTPEVTVSNIPVDRSGIPGQ